MAYTVLLTATGGGLSAHSINLFKASRRHDVRVVAVNAEDAPAARSVADAFHIVPRGGASGYVEALADVVRREGVDLVLPWSDEEALAVASSREAIEGQGCTLACADADTLRLFSQKHRCFDFLRSNGIRTPEYRLCNTREDLEAAIDHFAARGEFAVKPQTSRGNRDVFVIRKDVNGVRTSFSGREKHMDLATFRFDHKAAVETLLPVIVMERLREPAFDVDMLSQRGKALRIVPRQRKNPEGMPFLGNTIVPDARLVALGEAVASAAGLSWLYDVDVMVDAAGDPVVIECNPRPSGSCSASVSAGHPLFDDLISLAKGEALPPSPPLERIAVTPFTSLIVSS